MAAPHLVREWGFRYIVGTSRQQTLSRLPRMLYQHHLSCCAHCTLLFTYNYSILNDIYWIIFRRSLFINSCRSWIACTHSLVMPPARWKPRLALRTVDFPAAFATIGAQPKPANC